ncbi:EAL domain-containing protein [Aureimonas sp. ME7]|uniref:putative bifunctional diguanylate cyclase/phosphodiesterase n=1 Tax=Aureimonas sp. ME7 TaxID=2744252 RepID=UPI0015FD9727|nr:EAL domain-containing protein [Aureimonas sp. ME7]
MRLTYPYPMPVDEAERLDALASFSIFDTPAEKTFDRIVEIASRIFDVPIALVSLVGKNRQTFKARIGLTACETSRDVSFCAHAIMGNHVFVVPDATRDERFATNPLVTGEPHIRFYAGAPLIDENGHRLGSLCIIDKKPRELFSPNDQAILSELAAAVIERMQVRRLISENATNQSRLENITAASPDAIVAADGRNLIQAWNAAAETMFGFSAAQAIGQPLDIIIPSALRPAHRRGLQRSVEHGSSPLMGAPISMSALHADGTEFPIEISLSRWTENGEPRFGSIIRDITDRKRAEEKLRHDAEYDHLTELHNRASLIGRLGEAFRADEVVSLLMLDLDGFKDVNDNLGHAVGDDVLRVVALRLRRHIDPSHMVARLGGDEFVVLIPGCGDPLVAHRLASELIAVIEEPIELEHEVIHIGVSIGVALRTQGGCSAEELLGDADLALYQAKDDGRHLVRLFTPELRRATVSRSSISSGLRRAWEKGEFELYYQPQVHLEDRRLTGAEALIRWNRPNHGVVAPGAFISVLETSLLAVPVGEWILREACRQAAAWRAFGHVDFRMGVNLFAAQFNIRDFAASVLSALSDYGLPASALELEITENIILRHDKKIVEPLQQLREHGVGVAFDDFGTGFASLSMLKNYPVTRLKIDRSFVSDIQRSLKDRAIVESVINMARAFDLDVIAEGIETEDQANVLRLEECQQGQGYLFGRPMPAMAFEESLLASKPGAAATIACPGAAAKRQRRA